MNLSLMSCIYVVHITLQESISKLVLMFWNFFSKVVQGITCWNFKRHLRNTLYIEASKVVTTFNIRGRREETRGGKNTEEDWWNSGMTEGRNEGTNRARAIQSAILSTNQDTPHGYIRVVARWEIWAQRVASLDQDDRQACHGSLLDINLLRIAARKDVTGTYVLVPVHMCTLCKSR